jgi:hypothetical protein
MGPDGETHAVVGDGAAVVVEVGGGASAGARGVDAVGAVAQDAGRAEVGRGRASKGVVGVGVGECGGGRTMICCGKNGSAKEVAGGGGCQGGIRGWEGKSKSVYS